MTSGDFDARLRQYGELAVRVCLNLRAGQRLLIIGPLANGGVSLEAAPLVRHIAAAGYRVRQFLETLHCELSITLRADTCKEIRIGSLRRSEYARGALDTRRGSQPFGKKI